MKAWRFLYQFVIPHLLFWGNQALMLCVCLALLFLDETPLGSPITFFALTLGAGVAATAFWGLWRASSEPLELLKLLYGVQSPLFLAAMFWAFLVADPRPTALLVLALPAVAAATVFWQIWRRPDAPPGLVGRGAQTLTGIAALQFGGLGLLLVVPLLYFLVYDFVRTSQTAASWFALLAFGVYLALLASALLVFVIAPPFVFFLTWWRSYAPGSRARGAFATLLFAGLWLAGIHWLDRRPETFEVLAGEGRPPVASREWLRDPAALRRDLRHRYLASFRYAFTREQSPIHHLYSVDRVGSKGQALAFWAFEHLASPWIYPRVDLRQDQDSAAALYREVFDQSIREGEKAAIDAALASDWGTERFVSDETSSVRLEQQAIELAEHDGWAEITLVEKLVNTSWRNQEVVYEFSLPAHAVMTDLWLGPSEAKAQRFVGVVAPRGAAEKVYLDEKARNLDPALLAEVGPGLYRLRIFPVLPKSGENDSAPPLFAGFSYRILEQGGAWPLPQLHRSTNIRWDGKTHRRFAGKDFSWPTTEWWPAELPRRQSPLRRTQFTTQIGPWRIEAQPLGPGHPVQGESRPIPGPLAVIIDSSYSMQAVAAELPAALRPLRDAGVVVTYFLSTADQGGQPVRQEALTDLEFFGALDVATQLDQLRQWRGPREFAATLILTDHGDADFPRQTLAAAPLPEPTWLVHLGKKRPLAYAPDLLEPLVRSGGGVASSVVDVLEQLRRDSGAPGAAASLVVDGYHFTFRLLEHAEEPGASAAAEPAEEPGASAAATGGGFDPIAVHQLIRHWMRSPQAASLESMDALHRWAVEYRVVSPLSSLLVLIDDRQREALARAAKGDDRFTVSPPPPADTGHPFGISAVPEPEEWALLVVALVLFWLLRRGA